MRRAGQWASLRRGLPGLAVEGAGALMHSVDCYAAAVCVESRSVLGYIIT